MKPLGNRYFVVIILWHLAAAFGRGEVVRQPHIEAELVSEKTTLSWHDPFFVAVRLKMDPKWHTYWRNPGDSGEPIRIAWELPTGFSAGPILWPWPKRIEVPPLTNFGFDDEVLLLTQITVPAPSGNSAPETTVSLTANASWLVCEYTCIPGRAKLQLNLPISRGPAVDSPWKSRFEEARRAIPVDNPNWVTKWTDVGSDALELRVDGIGEPVASAAFFPNEEQIIENAAPQRFAQDPSDRSVTLRLTKSAHYEPTIDRAGVLVVKTSTTRGVSIASAAPSATTASAWTAMLFAFLGGMILNLMPCVFPVLFIKVLSFTSLAGADRKKTLAHGGMYAFGILVSFWALACLLLALRASGEQLGWGFQLQSPVFLAVLCFFLIALSLNLLGSFEIGTSWMGVGQGMASRAGLTGSFFSGVLATVVATPCTAPFMGSAMGFALTQPPRIALLVFTALGLGLSFPYVFFSNFPQLTRRLPRPGVWMETFKQAMAFPLLATALWLVWVFGLQVGLDQVARLLAAGLVVSFCLWGYGKPSRHPRIKNAFWIAVLGVAVGWCLLGIRREPSAAASSASAAEGWEPFSEASLQAAFASGRPVFIDFTAAWCITCQVNERLVLSLPSIKSKFAEKKVVLFRADWTNQNPEISKRLDGYGRNGVPLYALYGPGVREQPTILPQILTPEVVNEALDKL